MGIEVILKDISSTVLNINDGTRFIVAEEYVPLTVGVVAQMGGSTSSNKYSGVAKISEFAPPVYEFTFKMRVKGDNDAHTNANVQLLSSFLSRAQASAPVEMRVRLDDSFPEPTWGVFGAPIVYKIIHTNSVSIGSDWFSISGGEALPNVTVSVLIAGLPQSPRHKMLRGTGAIKTRAADDDENNRLGEPIGLDIVRGADSDNENEVKNPRFEDDVTTEWTLTGTGATAARDTTRAYTGAASMRLTSGSATAHYICNNTSLGDTDTIAVSSRVFREADVGVKIVIRDTTTAATRATINPAAIGEWEELIGVWTNDTGGAVNVAIRFVSDETDSVSPAWLDAVRMVRLPQIDDYFDGAHLGALWSSTVDASVQTWPAGEVVFDDARDVIRNGQGTVALVWQPDWTSTSFAADGMLWECNDKFKLLFDQSAAALFFGDGSGNIATAGWTFTRGDAPIFIASTWSITNGLNTYKDPTTSTAFATDATYTPVEIRGSELNIGQIDSANHIGGTFLGFWTWDVELTGAQVLAFYDSLKNIRDDVRQIGAMPTFWSLGGDNILHAVDGEVSSTEKNNWGVGLSIPGSATAVTVAEANASTAISTLKSIWISMAQTRAFIDPGVMYIDLSGTADSGTSSGDAYKVFATGSTELALSGISTTIDGTDYADLLANRKLTAFVRLADAVGDVNLRLQALTTSSGMVLETPLTALSGEDSTFRLFKLPDLTMNLPDVEEDLFGDYGVIPNLFVQLKGNRDSAGPSNMSIDFVQFVSGPWAEIISNTLATDMWVDFDGRRAIGLSTNNTAQETLSYQGDPMGFEPDRYNNFVILVTAVGEAYTVTYTLTLDSMHVTPRWRA